MITKITRLEKITSHQRHRMFQIMSLYYDHVERGQFDRDLNEKTHVILMFDDSGMIQGFSTILKTTLLKDDGRKIIALYSGDTVLDREHWGNGALGLAFGRYLTRVKIENPFTPTYWFLISKGYKTYLLMANNFPNHFPRGERETPPHVKRLLDQFYGRRFGQLYEPECGLIRPSSLPTALKVKVADIDDALLSHPRIRFFVDKNPSWQRGHELACIAEVSLWIPIRYVLKRIPKNLARLLLPRRREAYALHRN